MPARLKSWWVRHFRESVDYWFAGTIQEPTEAAACVKVLSNYHRFCNLYRCQFSVALLAAKYWTDPSFVLVKRTVILLTFREEWQFVMNFRRPLCLQSHNWVTSSLWPIHNPIAWQQRKLKRPVLKTHCSSWSWTKSLKRLLENWNTVRWNMLPRTWHPGTRVIMVECPAAFFRS